MMLRSLHCASHQQHHLLSRLKTRDEVFHPFRPTQLICDRQAVEAIGWECLCWGNVDRLFCIRSVLFECRHRNETSHEGLNVLEVSLHSESRDLRCNLGK